MNQYNYLKEDFLDAAHRSMVEQGNRNTVYTIEMLCILKEMADHDVWPDGRFGDDQCNVWSWFRN